MTDGHTGLVDLFDMIKFPHSTNHTRIIKNDPSFYPARSSKKKDNKTKQPARSITDHFCVGRLLAVYPIHPPALMCQEAHDGHAKNIKKKNISSQKKTRKKNIKQKISTKKKSSREISRPSPSLKNKNKTKKNINPRKAFVARVILTNFHIINKSWN